MSDALLVHVHEHVMTLTLNRPEQRNAMNAEIVAGLEAALRQAEADREIRAVVLTGAADRAFCAGADLAQGGSFQFDYSLPRVGFASLLRTAQASTRPLIARVNGACMAGGMGLLAMCDLAVAAPGAVFGLPEVKVGVFPMQVLAVLQGLIPERHLARLCFTGESVDAQTAMQIGLVNEVAEDLDAATNALVQAVIRNAPSAIRRGRYAMKIARNLSFEEAAAFTESQIGLLALTEDAREGLAAFKEKRKPQWTGR